MGPSSRRLRPSIHQTGDRIELPQGATPREGADDGADFVAPGQPMADCDFNQAALHPAYPIKCQTSTQRTQAPESVDTPKSLPPFTWDCPSSSSVTILRSSSAYRTTL